jgi:5'-nucleotidase
MGRETKILLALLGLLVGVFLGVVSIKLFVPRPPAGAGPDVHADIATIEAQTLVEPPELGPPPAPATEIAPTPPPPPVAANPPTDDPYAGHTSRFGGDGPATEVPRDPFVTPASFAAEEPEAQPPAPELLPPPVPSAAGDTYVARDGDSWWSLAERAYGDGRLYRALFAWNRTIDPRVSLTPGTRLEIPPAATLRTAWPALLPRD